MGDSAYAGHAACIGRGELRHNAQAEALIHFHYGVVVLCRAAGGKGGGVVSTQGIFFIVFAAALGSPLFFHALHFSALGIAYFLIRHAGVALLKQLAPVLLE